jgi:arabinan endo-1,5-alpha-L-arabinosidase
MRRRIWRQWLPILAAVLLAVLAGMPGGAKAATGTYHNPLAPAIPGDGVAESCADPTVMYGQEGEGRWYMYCTTDPLNDEDKTGSSFNFHLIPMFSSADLVNWVYEGDAFAARPGYATANAGLWAPEIKYYPETGQYHLYYTVTDTTLPGGGSAIGVATSDTPTGPWTHSATPVVEPHAADCCPGSRRWVFDPEVLRTDGPDYIYYGSYFGGISVRILSEDGLTSNPASQSNVAVANKYEGAEVAKRGGYYYLFVSATDCCRGPLTGYSVFVGRSTSPTGPFRDRSGVDLNDNEPLDDPTNARVGGSVVLSMNGNRWVGPGHNTVFQDFDGQWWTIYHAIDQNEPYFAGAVGFTKRPALLDPLDWVNGWPTVRGGHWASDEPMPAPAAQPRQTTDYAPQLAAWDVTGDKLGYASDEFNRQNLQPRWDWVREPAADQYGFDDHSLWFNTQAADLFEDSDNASVLTEPAPAGDYMVETRVRVNVPDEGCCFNYVQGGLVIYGDDDNYVRLVSVSIWNTRQTEFGKELFPVPAGYPRYGNTVVGPPGEWTWLRIVKRTVNGAEHYRAYTSRDGKIWERGGVWTHQLGASAQIGLVSMGGSGFTAEFDYVRVYTVLP